MDRVRVTIAALLPALWLMASGQCFADPCGGSATAGAGDAKVAFESGKHCPSNDPFSSDISVRRASGRIGSHFAKGNFFFTEPTTRSQVARRFSANFFSVRKGPL